MDENVIPMNTPATPGPLQANIRILGGPGASDGMYDMTITGVESTEEFTSRAVVAYWSAPAELVATAEGVASVETAVANHVLGCGALTVRLVQAEWEDTQSLADKAVEASTESDDPPDGRRVTKTLPCGMSDFERGEKARAMTELALEIERIEALQKRIKGLRESITEYAHQVDSGTIMRAVACAVYYDTPHAGMKRVVRMDTGEVVEESPMSQADMQPSLFEAATEDGSDVQPEVVTDEEAELSDFEELRMPGLAGEEA